MQRVRILLFFSLILFSSTATSCAPPDKPSTPPTSTIEVCSFHAAPWAYESNGRYLGFEPALLYEFLESLSMPLELHFQFVSTTELIANLLEGKCDISISRLTITQERQDMGLEFVPYLKNRVVIVAHPESVPLGEVSYGDLEELTWGSIRGSSYVAVIRDLYAPRQVETKFWDEPPVPGERGDPLINNLLMTRKVDVVAVDAALMMSLMDVVPEYSNLRIVGFLSPPSGSDWGVAFRKGDPRAGQLASFLESFVRRNGGEDWKNLLVEHLGEGLGEVLLDTEPVDESEE